MWKLRRHAEECSTSHDEHMMCSLGQLCLEVIPCMGQATEALVCFQEIPKDLRSSNRYGCFYCSSVSM
jgi:hypothetical protein